MHLRKASIDHFFPQIGVKSLGRLDCLTLGGNKYKKRTTLNSKLLKATGNDSAIPRVKKLWRFPTSRELAVGKKKK